MNDIDKLRKACGTLPFNPENKQEFTIDNIKILSDNIKVYLIDSNYNPYRAMFSAATATWGDNKYEDKWLTTSMENKFEIIKGVLTDNTLPLAREVVNFLFRVQGTPRWLFDYHVTNVNFLTAMSIGCRDNNKCDTDIVLDTHHVDEEVFEIFRDLRNVYSDLVFDSENRETWQSARAFLPQNYQHSYHFNQNLLSMSRSFDLKKISQTIEGAGLVLLYDKIIECIKKHYPLIAEYVRLSLFENRDFSSIKDMTYSEFKETNVNSDVIPFSFMR